MASNQRSSDPAIGILRAIAYRLSSAPPANLPHILTHLSSQIGPCKEFLSNPQPTHSEAASLVHQIRTRTSSLLQDRLPEARLAAVILIKALVEAGGYETLATNGGPWVKSLISLIARQDSTGSSTRRLVIITVTRIITLAKDHDSLAREISTPNLPPFVTACLTVFEGAKDKWGSRQRALIETVLKSWMTLIPRHTATFRPFIGRILGVLSRIIELPDDKVEDKPEREKVQPSIKDAARSVYVLLHNSSTKAGSLSDRDTGLSRALKIATSATQETFPAVFGSDKVYGRNLHVQSDAPLSSAEEICEKLEFVRSYITTPSFKSVSIPIGRITSLITQIASITRQQNNAGSVTKREKEQFLIDLPSIHLTVLDLAGSILSRFGTTSISISIQLLEATLSIFVIHQHNSKLQEACYNVTSDIVSLIGPALSKKEIARLSPLIQACCADLLPILPQNINQSINSATSKTTLTNTSLISTKVAPKSSISKTNSPHLQSQSNVLTTLLRHLPAVHTKPSIRALLDRTAILTQNAEAIVASTLNPALGRGVSLLPFAARSLRARHEIESIIRPRVPAVVFGKLEIAATEEDEEKELAIPQNDWFRNNAASGAEDAEHDEEKEDVEPETNESAKGLFDTHNEPAKPDINPAREAFEKLKNTQSMLTTSIKHTLFTDEDDSGITSPPKRPRIESEAITKHKEFSLPVVEQNTGNIQTITKPIIHNVTNDASDNDSDFEVPKLVWLDEDPNDSDHSSEG